MDEGQQYKVGDVRVEVRIADVDPGAPAPARQDLARRHLQCRGRREVPADHHDRGREPGYAFSQVRPHGNRDPATGTIGITYVVEEGPRVYIERINMRGNTRTRDNVIRREFDVGEGDAYNKVLIDKAERRLNNLGYFKNVRITNEPGSTPDRVIVNVDVEDQPTGQFSIAGGYSTSDGFIAEVSVAETNFLGRGQYVRVAGFERPVLAGRRVLVHRALLHGSPHRGRLRPVLEADGQHPLLLLREHDDRRHAARRPASH